jgi:hypothetical protein
VTGRDDKLEAMGRAHAKADLPEIKDVRVPQIDDKLAAIDDKLKAMHGGEAASDEVERDRLVFSALELCSTHRKLPFWVYVTLSDVLAPRLPRHADLHGERWLRVRQGHHNGLSWPKSYAYASEQLAGTPYEGGWRTMKESYNIVQGELKGAPPRRRRKLGHKPRGRSGNSRTY